MTNRAFAISEEMTAVPEKYSSRFDWEAFRVLPRETGWGIFSLHFRRREGSRLWIRGISRLSSVCRLCQLAPGGSGLGQR
jgi:hypothetical protein